MTEPELFTGTDDDGIEYLLSVYREDGVVSRTIAIRHPVTRRWGPPVELRSES